MSAGPSGRPSAPAYMRDAPKVGPLPSLVAPTPIRFRLTSGLEVIALPRRTAPIVAMNLIVRNGADQDTPAKAGLASLTAEMLDEGAGDRSAIELSEAVDRLAEIIERERHNDARPCPKLRH